MKAFTRKPAVSNVRPRTFWIDLDKFHAEMKRWKKGTPEQSPQKK